MTPQKTIRQIYRLLLKAYGRQGWWPVLIARDGQRDAFDNLGYHRGYFDIPANSAQQLEIALGAVLTQNTSWHNASLALRSLADSGLVSLPGLQGAKIEQIALAIKSAGYYNQKASTVKNLVRFLQQFPFETLEGEDTLIVRDRLLQIKGIGPETADCILLYALKKPSFVVDAYTRRIVAGMGLLRDTADYESLKRLFESSLERDLAVYQEYHALLVRHGKTHYSRKPHGNGDVILRPWQISGRPGRNKTC